jgi:hypothetical protein
MRDDLMRNDVITYLFGSSLAHEPARGLGEEEDTHKLQHCGDGSQPQHIPAIAHI